MSIKSSASSKQSVYNNVKSQISREQKKSKVKGKTKSWWQLKRLHAELPPQSEHPAKFSGHKSCEMRIKLNCHMNSCCSCDQRILWL